jgi:5-aminolevulinate synthase
MEPKITIMNFNFPDHLNTLLATLKTAGNYRRFRTLERPVSKFPEGIIRRHDGSAQNVTIWCSNDYLGMGHNPAVLAAMETALRTHGAGAGGTRNIAGTTAEMVALENLLALHHEKEAALVFTSGYTANEGALAVLGRMLPDAVIFSDALNHASMISGMKTGGCEKKIFPHNDIDALKKLLMAEKPGRPKIIAIESVYSMEGSVAPLRDIIRLARQFGALTYLDEVHAVGMYGAHGAGMAEQMGVMNDIDIIEGTFGKAYGVHGGYIAGSHAIVDVIRSFASSFIFTTALPPAVLAGAAASIQHLRTSNVEREKQRHAVDRLKFRLKAAGLPYLDGHSHIVPLIVGDAHCCQAVSEQLLDRYNIYVQPINYPTVPKGTERLRLTPTACHTDAHVDALTQALTTLWQHHQIPLKAIA